MKKLLLSIITVAAVALSRPIATGQTLAIKVSDSLLPLNQKWAEAYEAKHAGAVIQVTGDTTSEVLATLAEKKADLVVIPRGIHFREAQACEAAFGSRPVEFKAAVSGVAVYVNASNPVKVMTYEELAGIFLGESPNWKEFDGGLVQPINIYALATNSSCGELFNEEVLDGRGFTLKAHLLAGEDVLKAIAADPNGIGIGPLATAEGIRALTIKRARSSTPVNPTEDTISRRIYPISRYVFFYANPAASPADIKSYVDWVRSDEGQQIARAAGFYELPTAGRSHP